MAATKPWVQQLAQSGATPGQAIVWDGTTWVPGTASAGTICRSVLTAVGGERVLYLNAVPITNSEQVFVNGLLKTWTADYALSGSVVTFTSALTVGQVVAVIYQSSGVCGVAALGPLPTGFTRPVTVTRPPRRFHRIR